MDADVARLRASQQAIILDFRASRARAWIIKRFSSLYRAQLHKIEDQLTREGTTMPFEQILDKRTLYINLMTPIGKATPYQAVSTTRC